MKIYPFQINEIIEKYKSGKSSMEIAKEYGVFYTTINSILKRNNISLKKATFPKSGMERLKNSLY